MIVVLMTKFFSLFDDSANKTKALNLKVNCKKLRLVFVHHVNRVPKYLRLFEQVDTLHFYIIFISIIILLSLQGSVIKRPTDSTTSTTSGQTNGQRSTTS